MRTRYLPFLVAAALALPAAAEKADREKDIVIGADVATADDVNRTSTFDGNVVITQGTMRITAARVNIKEDAKRYKYYVATGSPVTFRQKRDNTDEWVEGFAQRAEFDDRDDMLKLHGNARVKSNQNEIAGEFISYDMRRELAKVTGAPPGQVAPPGSRVKVIIVPAKKEEAAGNEPPAAAPKLKADTGVK